MLIFWDEFSLSRRVFAESCGKIEKSRDCLQEQPEGLLHVQALHRAPRAGDGEARVRDEGAPVPHVRHHPPGARGRGHLAEVQGDGEWGGQNPQQQEYVQQVQAPEVSYRGQ